MEPYVCIDIGGTAVKHGVLLPDLTFAEQNEESSRGREGGKALMEQVMAIIARYLDLYPVKGICISTAGMVDCEKGEIFYSGPQIPGYTGMKIKDMLGSRFHLPCEVENDVNCAGLAEYYAGAAKGCDSVLMMTIGTGIGACLILDGKIYRGHSGSACEIGYMRFAQGEFQDLASVPAMIGRVRRAKKEALPVYDGKTLFQYARSGDPDCVRAIRETCALWGMGIADLCYAFNPQTVVLGGGIMAESGYLRPLIEQSMRDLLLPSIAEHTRLAFAQNGNRAGMLGAYLHYRLRHPQ